MNHRDLSYCTPMCVMLAAMSVVGAAYAESQGSAAAGTAAPSAPAANVQPTPAQDECQLRLSAGTSFQADTDLEDKGDFKFSRWGAGVSLRQPLPDNTLRIDHNLTYERDSYSFSGLDTPKDPWGDVNALTYIATFRKSLEDSDWSIFGGPIVGFAAEDGANIANAINVGVSAGAIWRASKDLTIGLGVVAADELQQRFTILPLPILDWRITDDLHLASSRSQPGLRGRGIELIWSFAPKWELGAGAGYERRRFRLSDSSHYMPDSNEVTGYTSNGIGQNTSFPMYLRLGYELSDSWSFTGVLGVVTGGELRLEDNGGHKVASQDYDTAPYMGIAATWRL